MKAPSRVEEFARKLSPLRVESVRRASVSKTEGRVEMLRETFGDSLDDARTYAASIKDYVLANLKPLLLQFEDCCKENGINVHWAADAAGARRAVLEIVAKHCSPGQVIVKGKSMATEEVHLNHALADAGYKPLETDLGEFVVQIDGDTPSHIVTPIIHKNRKEIAESFTRHGLGPYTEQPEELTLQARAHLREQFQKAAVGISGVNFAVAETGRIVIVENEGNNRLSTTAPDVHIAVMGIEKLIPKESDLPVFLKLLAGSATAQAITTYVHFISGPRRPDEPDGPRELHVILLDAGRTRTLSGPFKPILRCIRCGACLNVCPVYRQASGHAYGHVYGGPLGEVLAPALEGVEKLGDLAKASTLCGACEEVCPVKIPIPHMLLQIRATARESGVSKNDIAWLPFALAAKSSLLWRAAIRAMRMASRLPSGLLAGWTRWRDLPQKQGREFRRWWRERSR